MLMDSYAHLKSRHVDAKAQSRAASLVEVALWTVFARLLGGALIGVMLCPLLALILTVKPDEFLLGLSHPLVAPALKLSLVTTAISLIVTVVAGTPLAWRLAQSTGPKARWLEIVLQLPIVTPPAVAGVALLIAFGRRGVVGTHLEEIGLSIPFSTIAVVLAQIFVAAPLYLQGAIVAFKRVDENMLMVGRTLGSSSLRLFVRIAIPPASSGLIAAMAVSWARALGEFGATLMFAGNLSGRTQTLPLVIYEVMETDARAAQSLSVMLVAVALGVLCLAPRAA
jgi:molybdate transport system permease protein